ncbi:hypothetical protein [Kribbella pittospori]|nr:hypothetical protein [Kribbella pittospori]
MTPSRCPPAFVDLAGLFQRLTVTVGFAWLTALAVRELRRT